MSNGLERKKEAPSVELGELGQYLQTLRSDILEDVDNKLQKSIVKIVTELEFKQRKNQNGFIDKSTSKKVIGRPREKEFVVRNSALVDLWKIREIRSLYSYVLAVFILLYICLAIFYCLNVPRFKHDMALVSWTFSKFHIVCALWLIIHFSIVFGLYPVFRFWATNRTFAKNKGLYDSMFITLLILYGAAIYIIPAAIIIVFDIPTISSFIMLLEQIRLCMKCYAFVRENVPRVLKYKPHQDGDKENADSCPCPEVGNLVYFIFAPTLVYRDRYPRTTHIRWNYVGWHILQLIYTVLGYFVAFVLYSVNTFQRAGLEPIPFSDFVLALAGSVFAGAVVLVMGFYATLHSMQEVIGEMLRFGDRRFYDDWWNSTSYGQFYRSWNMLVYDFIYYYVYRDMYAIFGKRRMAALWAVFIVSAVVHEYILAVSCKFLFPMLSILFLTCGVLFVFMTRSKTSGFWNIFFWTTLFTGFGLLFVAYTLEWYARINCPRTIDSWHDYIVPRSFYCEIISWPS